MADAKYVLLFQLANDLVERQQKRFDEANMTERQFYSDRFERGIRDQIAKLRKDASDDITARVNTEIPS